MPKEPQKKVEFQNKNSKKSVLSKSKIRKSFRKENICEFMINLQFNESRHHKPDQQT